MERESRKRKRITKDDAILASARIYLLMSDDALNNLLAFNDDDTIAFYPIGKQIFGKASLLEFIKSIKQR